MQLVERFTCFIVNTQKGYLVLFSTTNYLLHKSEEEYDIGLHRRKQILKNFLLKLYQ